MSANDTSRSEAARLFPATPPATPEDNMPPHVDHRTCMHDFIALEEGAVGCTICYWVWEVEEPLE